MKAKDAILDLGIRFEIEAPHTEHVTRLALDLFDGFFPFDGMEKSDRNLLYVAARLHDIAYSIDPENHVTECAGVLAENRIEGFSPDEWLSIIGISLLHKRDWRSMLNDARFPGVGAKELERIKKLAAILRVADGLDHGHIQDSRIFYCRRGRTVDQIGVKTKWYRGNVPWAEGKADLWEAVFKRGFRIEEKLKLHKKIFKGVVHKKDSAANAARRILYSQWDIMRDNVPGMLEGKDLECLHDYRVAMRRFRAALRMFRQVLEETHANALDERLSELSDRLSPVRDAHVARQFFQKTMVETGQHPQKISELESRIAEANRLLKEIIESNFCLETVQLTNRFLRVELPSMERQLSAPSFALFAREHLKPVVNRIVALDVSNLRNGDPAHMHHVRKLCRRGRYFAEFAAPVLGKDAQQMAKMLKGIAGALGDVRDARSLMQQLGDASERDAVIIMENKAWECFETEWLNMMDTGRFALMDVHR